MLQKQIAVNNYLQNFTFSSNVFFELHMHFTSYLITLNVAFMLIFLTNHDFTLFIHAFIMHVRRVARSTPCVILSLVFLEGLDL